MKSDRQAARMALICFELGRFAAAGGAGAAGAGGGGVAAAGGGTAVAAGGGGAAAAGAADGAGVSAAAGFALTAAWQPGESCPALARRQSRSSGLLGWIHEQCDMKSSSVQARRTALS